jgi:hypothetical protein
MNIDMENRLIDSFIALIAGDAAINSAVAGRVRKYGSQTEKAAYPCILVQIANLFPFDAVLGWYKASVNLIAATHIADDPDMATLRTLAGMLRGLIQSGRMDKELNMTQPARTRATALTVADAELADTFEEEDGNARIIGQTVAVVCRPSIGQNQG